MAVRDPDPVPDLFAGGAGLNILTGYAGQLSLGTAFMAVGAFASYNFILRIPACRCCWRLCWAA
jgi:ABC-type branched-subunit amino acid transport system permease subunit